MKPIATLIVLSSAHEVLFREYFLPTLPAGLQIVPMQMGANTSDGAYLSEEWQDAMCAKIRHALAFCRQAAEGEPFIVSDVDVQFFPAFNVEAFLNYFDSLGCDLAFQKERFRPGDTEVNCGFYTGRNNAAVRALLEASLEMLEKEEVKNEQSIINLMLRRLGVRFTTLDGRFYARTHGFPPPRDLWMHHASWTMNVPEKIRQLDRVRRIVKGGSLRLHAESYAEHLTRAIAKRRGIAGIVDANREYFTGLPLKPCSLP